jgi:hypothetical protein
VSFHTLLKILFHLVILIWFPSLTQITI